MQTPKISLHVEPSAKLVYTQKLLRITSTIYWTMDKILDDNKETQYIFWVLYYIVSLHQCMLSICAGNTVM